MIARIYIFIINVLLLPYFLKLPKITTITLKLITLQLANQTPHITLRLPLIPYKLNIQLFLEKNLKIFDNFQINSIFFTQKSNINHLNIKYFSKTFPRLMYINTVCCIFEIKHTRNEKGIKIEGWIAKDTIKYQHDMIWDDFM